ncbi:MAG: bifunctional methylenetetrahydrofolate dehydrogenase/methenyltetrahydrofolate cyclohydrolase FolD [Bacillota bacterium]
MTAKIIDGKMVAERIKEDLKQKIEKLKQRGIIPGLAVVMVGDDPASRIYVNMKQKTCTGLGIYSEGHALSADASRDKLLELIARLNGDPRIHGILVQLPLPGHFEEEEILFNISPDKDVDGFHPVNVGRLFLGKPSVLPCTPAGVMELIKETGTEIKGKECVVVGRSNIVGKPQAILLLAEHGTVTICHSRTRDLGEVCRRADILVVAAGKPRLVKGDMIKPGAVVIDVGTNRVGEKRLTGDVDFDSAGKTAGFITPVPGGVGPMTIAMLMKNTVTAAERSVGL